MLAGVLDEKFAAIFADFKVCFLLFGFICIPGLDAVAAAEGLDRVRRDSEFLANASVRIVEFSELKNTAFDIMFDIITPFLIVIV